MSAASRRACSNTGSISTASGARGSASRYEYVDDCGSNSWRKISIGVAPQRASCARMRGVARNALAPRAGAFGELEDQHPCQHCRDEHDRLELARAERYKRWAGTESGESPADAEGEAAEHEPRVDDARR